MNSAEILYRNLISLLSGTTDLTLIDNVYRGLPKGSATDKAYSQLVNGPAGDVTFGCPCQGIEGYQLALKDMLVLIDTAPLPKEVSDDAKAAVNDERRRIRQIIFAAQELHGTVQ